MPAATMTTPGDIDADALEEALKGMVDAWVWSTCVLLELARKAGVEFEPPGQVTIEAVKAQADGIREWIGLAFDPPTQESD